MNDRKLMIRIKNGEANALDELLERLYPSIYRFVYVLMDGSESAKDITQETLVRFLKHIDTYQERCKIETYVCSIALNLVRDEYRKHRRHPEDELTIDIKDHKDDPHTLSMKQSQKDELMHCMKVLPEEQREVILLRYHQHFKIREIALLYGIKENTVKTRIRLGLKKLREEMERQQ